MDVEPSQPAEFEFVEEGEQDEIFQKQHQKLLDTSATKSTSKAHLLDFMSNKNSIKKSTQKDMVDEADDCLEIVGAKNSQSQQDYDIELEIENDIFDDGPKTDNMNVKEPSGGNDDMQEDNLGNQIRKLDLKEGAVALKQKKKQRADGYSVYETFTCMLNLTDISYGEKGHNKFYQIEVLHKGYTVFTLYTKWGRVGAQNPQESYKKMDNKYDAILGFKKKFYDKTHNDWTGMYSDFKPQPGKYTWIQVDMATAGKGSVNDDVEKINKRNAELKKRINTNPCKLEQSIKELMNIIWDFNRINKTLKELNFDTEKNPLGRLTFDQIQKGYKILTEIQNALLQGSRTSIIIELTNQFYTNIPQNYGMRALPMVDHITKVKEKLHLLDVLKEIDITNRYINSALQTSGSESINPLDTFYSMLKCKINRIDDRSSEAFQTISKMVENTHGPTHNKFKLKIVDIFELNRNQENQRFFPFRQLPNQYLLWHGSRISNFVGILSEGLRIAPPEAPMTGYMFGKGIYLADVVSKAASYCHAKQDSPEGLLVLCETALGQIYSCNKAKAFKKPPIYYHSVKGVGKQKTQDEGVAKLGTTNCFTGQVVDNDDNGDGQPKDLVYNEYIVYDTSQVKMKYLIRVNFEFL